MNNGRNHRLAGRRVAKMNGAGNEIVVLDLRDTEMRVSADEARAIGAARGLRFDQLMALYAADSNNVWVAGRGLLSNRR